MARKTCQVASPTSSPARPPSQQASPGKGPPRPPPPATRGQGQSPVHGQGQGQVTRKPKLLESCMVLRIEEFIIYRISTSDNKRSAPKKFFCSDKKALHLPSDMSMVHIEYTDYFFTEGLEYPGTVNYLKLTKVFSSCSQIFVDALCYSQQFFNHDRTFSGLKQKIETKKNRPHWITENAPLKYSKICVKRPLKNRQNKGLNDSR